MRQNYPNKAGDDKPVIAEPFFANLPQVQEWMRPFCEQIKQDYPEYWVAVVKPGRVMFELAGVSEEKAREAMRLAMHKLPVKCKFVKREDLEVKGGE